MTHPHDPQGQSGPEQPQQPGYGQATPQQQQPGHRQPYQDPRQQTQYPQPPQVGSYGTAGAQQSAYGQAHPQHPPAKRRKVPTWLIVVAGVVLVACCGGGALALALSAGDDDTPSTTSANGDGDEAGDGADGSEVPGIGDPARDGKFEFTVTELETGVESVGSDTFGETAQGQFVLVHLTVENIGDESQLFDGSSQALIDTESREHSADSGAAIYLEDSDSFLNEINPGNSVDGIVVFDIPIDAVPDTLRLHDSPFSGGVEVTVAED